MHVKKDVVLGCNIFTLDQPAVENTTRVIYLHGGAYVQGFTKFHWSFITQMVEEAQCAVIAPDYPLAPVHTYETTFELVESVYRKVIVSNPPSSVVLMGDSSGGGLALALAQKLKEKGMPQPSQIILLSPWLDITLSNQEIKNLDSKDPFLGIEGLTEAGLKYAGGKDPFHFQLSPIYGSLNGLGAISVFVGTREILVADTRKLKRIADASGIPIAYFEYPDMVHAWMLFDFPESRRAKEQIFRLISKG